MPTIYEFYLLISDCGNICVSELDIDASIGYRLTVESKRTPPEMVRFNSSLA